MLKMFWPGRDECRRIAGRKALEELKRVTGERSTIWAMMAWMNAPSARRAAISREVQARCGRRLIEERLYPHLPMDAGGTIHVHEDWKVA